MKIKTLAEILAESGADSASSVDSKPKKLSKDSHTKESKKNQRNLVNGLSVQVKMIQSRMLLLLIQRSLKTPLLNQKKEL